MVTKSDTSGGMKPVNSCAGKKSGNAGMRTMLRAVLAAPDFEEELPKLDIVPGKLIGPLLSFLYETDEIVRWRAVRAVGIIVARMARNSPESARNIMRRLMWSLNDESGGIGWGAPEAMGEIMASDEQLALEYHRILLSYIDEGGNPLEHDQLERGVLWGIGRLASVRPELVRGAVGLVAKQLNSPDAVKRALALWVISILGPASLPAHEPLELLHRDETEVRIYQDGKLVNFRISDLADRVLAGCR
ncbi:MAG: DVU0298 family protein [Syntrophobacter sp.]